MKRILTLVLAILLVCSALPVSALAADPNGTATVTVYDYSTKSYQGPKALPIVALKLNGSYIEGDMPGVNLNGRTLAPLRLLAEGLGAHVEWLQETSQVIVRKGGDNILLTLGSSTAYVNGEAKALPDGVPATMIVYQGQGYTMVPYRFFGETFGCDVDWDQATYTATVTDPAYTPGRSISELSTPINPGSRLIVLDAGHGGYGSPGAYYDETKECDLTLEMTQKLRDILVELGYKVLMTRDSDIRVELKDRSAIANNAGATIFVSIHCNALGPGYEYYDGLQVYYYPSSTSGRTLAQAIQTPACEFCGARDLGINSDNFAVVRETKMPAVLIETGFMTCPQELRNLRDATYQKNMMLGVAQGIINYLNNY